MTPNRPQLSSMSNRQKVTAGIFALVVLFLLYQIWGLFRGGSSSAPTAVTAPTKPQTAGTTPSGLPSPQSTPQPAQLPKTPAVMTQREADLLKLQQQTEAKYIATLNELQQLRLEQQIAETNKAIASARLETVTAEKGIVDLLKPPAPPPVTTASYAQNLVQPTSGATTTITPPTTVSIQPATQPEGPELAYTVISVTQLQHRWNAVLGLQGNLYSVSVGDIMPPDRSRVIRIDKTGVVLERNGIRKKISMVPII